MNRFPAPLAFILVAAGTLGIAFYHQCKAQAELDAQLYQIDQVLIADNDDAAGRTSGMVKGIEAGVVKNWKQPGEVAALATAKQLHAQADSLVRAFRSYSHELSRVTNNLKPSPALPNPDASRKAAKLLGRGSSAELMLHQQFANYKTAIHAVTPQARERLSWPSFDGLPTVAALATLAELESNVRVAEMQALQQLAQRVRSVPFFWIPKAFVSAESNTVAPGTTYRAHLFLKNTLDLRHVSLAMHCNGQPIDVVDNVGLVRFVAPLRPGPASWHGSIRFNTNGRDTTFQVQVPYRIAHR